MSKTLRLLLPMLLAAGVASAASDVVVLRGGARIELKQPPVRQGNNVLLTRKDGTLLSVPLSEIDTKATASAKAPASAPPASSAVAAPPESPADAARATRGGPKARVRVTDADVGHYMESPTAPGEETPAASASAASGAARVDVSDYNQSKHDDNLIVKGMLRNLGSQTALNVSLTVTPLDEKGNAIDSVEASVSNGTLEAGKAVNFSATVPIGTKTVSVMRFSPRWITQAPPPAPGGSGSASAATASGAAPAAGAAPAPAAPPAAAAARPTPMPYGQGTLYAAPAPNAPNVAPADGKSGYIPGAATPENQPKPPE